MGINLLLKPTSYVPEVASGNKKENVLTLISVCPTDSISYVLYCIFKQLPFEYLPIILDIILNWLEFQYKCKNMLILVANIFIIIVTKI